MSVIVKPHATREPEEKITKIDFNVFKFTKKPKPIDPSKILIICCFSEFGCETLGVNYCVPYLLEEHPDKYIIIVGWYGRDYFYKHLADEFWELKEEHMWLRNKTGAAAFHHHSRNLSLIEGSLTSKGVVCPSAYLGQYAVGNKCKKCGKFYPPDLKQCPDCEETESRKSIFGNMIEAKRKVVRLPLPSNEMMEKAKFYLKDNPIGIFARGRACYGRNLTPEFYERLILLLEKMGYNPIWLGEKATVQPCPVDHIVDFSRMPESRNLELTLAIIKQLKFTVQYWTASTRLAGMMGVPYLLFESPDQVYGIGQEGLRRNLCDFAPNKLVIAHFKNMYENNDYCLKLTERAIREMEFFDFNDLCEENVVTALQIMRNNYAVRIFGIK